MVLVPTLYRKHMWRPGVKKALVCLAQVLKTHIYAKKNGVMKRLYWKFQEFLILSSYFFNIPHTSSVDILRLSCEVVDLVDLFSSLMTLSFEPATLCAREGGWGDGDPKDQSTDTAPSRDFLKNNSIILWSNIGMRYLAIWITVYFI